MKNIKFISFVAFFCSLATVYAVNAQGIANIPTVPTNTPTAVPPANVVKTPFKRVFLSKEEMDKLNLTDEQQQKWQDIIKERQAVLQPFFDQMRSIREEQQKVMEKFNDKIAEILTPEQNSLYQQMIVTPPVKK